MKIAYIDLNYADHYESYSVAPKKYGGGRVFAAQAKEFIPDFHIYARKESFEDLNPLNEKYENCHHITQNQIDEIRHANKPIEEVIPDTKDVDIFVHHFTNIHLNTPKPQIVWSIGYKEVVHPENTHVMLYSLKNQQPVFSHNNHVLYNVVIGNTDNTFQEYRKDDYIFQCTRHVKEFGSIEVAHICKNNKIKVIFAGPLDNETYPLMKYIDNNYTLYLGVIPESIKINYLKSARLTSFIHSWPTPFNLSAAESLRYGTPIVCTNIGFWPDIVQEGINGFIISDEKQFLNAWEKSKDIKQFDCFNTAQHYSIANMIKTFETSIKLAYAAKI